MTKPENRAEVNKFSSLCTVLEATARERHICLAVAVVGLFARSGHDSWALALQFFTKFLFDCHCFSFLCHPSQHFPWHWVVRHSACIAKSSPLSFLDGLWGGSHPCSVPQLIIGDHIWPENLQDPTQTLGQLLLKSGCCLWSMKKDNEDIAPENLALGMDSDAGWSPNGLGWFADRSADLVTEGSIKVRKEITNTANGGAGGGGEA